MANRVGVRVYSWKMPDASFTVEVLAARYPSWLAASYE
ncbi:Uncharacterised protein [Mycobacteroides abscessus subsp. abscessus]|nr:Uncharacterised protein [Mycobacteroides abscessus subsp. abscessus]SKV51123.1 Uncharacterised protein [Mycobacteroides abscessus subsp. abscessus]